MAALLGAGAEPLELWVALLFIVGPHSLVGGVIFAWGGAPCTLKNHHMCGWSWQVWWEELRDVVGGAEICGGRG